MAQGRINDPLLERDLGNGFYVYTVVLILQATLILLFIGVCAIVRRKNEPVYT